MELGIYTFVDLTADPVTKKKISPAERYRNLPFIGVLHRRLYETA